MEYALRKLDGSEFANRYDNAVISVSELSADELAKHAHMHVRHNRAGRRLHARHVTACVRACAFVRASVCSSSAIYCTALVASPPPARLSLEASHTVGTKLPKLPFLLSQTTHLLARSLARSPARKRCRQVLPHRDSARDSRSRSRSPPRRERSRERRRSRSRSPPPRDSYRGRSRSRSR